MFNSPISTQLEAAQEDLKRKNSAAAEARSRADAAARRLSLIHI